MLNGLSLLWVAFEIWLVARDRSHGKGRVTRDRGTRYLNFAAIAAGITAAGILGGSTYLPFPGGRTAGVSWAGFALMVCGFGIRVWAVATLGASFRTTVETHSNQKVVRSGPYRRLRHPSYSGLLLMCLGYGVAVQNWLALGIAVGLPLAALLYRIRVEEDALITSLGADYVEYKRSTKRLIPWVW